MKDLKKKDENKSLKKDTSEKELSKKESSDKKTSEKKTVKKRKFINKAKMKYGTYAIVISAIVIAAAIAVNVLFGVLAKRVHLDVDISLKGYNTLSPENIDYIETLTVPVTITVCASKDGYVSNLDYYTGQSFGVSSSGSAYYSQTVTLLEYYDEYSDMITLEFIDFQDPEFSEIISKYGTLGFNYGDIIVTATHKMADGTENVRNTIVAYDDIYSMSDPSYFYYGYSSGSYIISGNNLEKALSGAIRKVSSTETKKVGVISAHCSPTTVDYYASVLELNNFDVETIGGDMITEISDEYSMLIISAPASDFAIDELDIISEWLDNNGQYGRGLLFFASVTSPELPNLYGRLEEWGIIVEQGVLFDTNSFTHSANDPMTMRFIKNSDADEIMSQMTNGATNYAFSSGVPISYIEDPKANTSVFVPVYTSSSEVAVAPNGSGLGWEPTDDDVLARQNGIVVSMEEVWANNEASRSYIVAFSSHTFISEEMYTSYGNKDNIHAAVNIANVVTGVEEATFFFDMKTFDEVGYTVSDGAAKAVQIIFQWTIPALVLVTGIVVFVRRKRR